jgi:hypothetical protein
MSSYRPVLDGERVRIAFLFQIASLWPSWESFFQNCSQDKRFDVKLYLVQDNVDMSLQSRTAQPFLEKAGMHFTPFSDEAFRIFAPHVAVIQTPYEYLHRQPHLYSLRLKSQGIRVIYIPYGIELVDTKSSRHEHFREPVIRNAWRIYTLSDAFLEEYRRYCENAEAVRGLGLPRFDSLAQKERHALPDDLRERIGNRKVIVWHVHFAKSIDTEGGRKQVTPYLEEYLAFAQAISSFEEEHFFIFLPHPRFGDDAVDTVSNRKSAEILQQIGSAENAFTDTADDYRPALLNADAIITDRSALMIESALAGVPILYLKNPDYDEPVFPPLAPLTDSYYQGHGYDDMIRFLDMLSRGEDERKVDREVRLRECVPCLDGKCGERIRTDIFMSVKAELSPGRAITGKIRVIIFGTGFLYRKIMSFYTFPDNCEVVALSDNDPSKWNKEFDGIVVVPPWKIRDIVFDKVIIMAGNVFEEQIHRQLRFDLEIPENKIAYCEYLAIIHQEGEEEGYRDFTSL